LTQQLLRPLCVLLAVAAALAELLARAAAAAGHILQVP
jgi:hypothetical protein